MPFTNFDNRHFTAAEKTAVNNAITAAETALLNKQAVLTPEERQQYGSVNEQNKLIINKVKDFRDLQPGLGCPDVDWVEFPTIMIHVPFFRVLYRDCKALLTD